jgi:hypothetical protein
MGRGNKAQWQKLDDNGCQTFDKRKEKPSAVIEKLQIWDPVKKGHCTVQLCSTGAAVIVCLGCKGELSPANYGGSWSQHSSSCQKLAEFLAEKQATPKKRKAAKDAASPTSSPEVARGTKQRKITVFTVSAAQQATFIRNLVLWAVQSETPISRLDHATLREAVAPFGATIPTRQTMSTTVLDSRYEEAKQRVDGDLLDLLQVGQRSVILLAWPCMCSFTVSSCSTFAAHAGHWHCHCH